MTAKRPRDAPGTKDALTDAPANGPSFEDALTRLEAIVEELESGEASLEASLVMFEEGITLSRRCNERLVAVERHLEVLVRKADGEDACRPLAEEEFFPAGEASGSTDD